MAGQKQIPKAEYEHLSVHHFRDHHGNYYTVYWDDHDDDGPIYVKQVRDHVTVQKVTPDQWENAVLNHGLRESAAVE